MYHHGSDIASRGAKVILGDFKSYILKWFVAMQRATEYKQIYSTCLVLKYYRGGVTIRNQV